VKKRKTYLTAAEVADRRRKTTQALANERKRGEGPPYVKDNGRVLYPADELDRYLEDRIVVPAKAKT
jgi:hypothetical protein